MAFQINIARAKATLSELVAMAEAGEEVVLARAGKPVATIQALGRARLKAHRRIGALAHLGPVENPNTFLEPDPDLEAAAEARDEDHLYR